MSNTPTANSILNKVAKGDLLWHTTVNANSDAIDAYLARGAQNLTINGDFRINQRVYASAGTLAAGTCGHDCWKAGASGGNYSFTQLKSPTQITIAANKSLIQVIEDRNVEGGSYTLSWTGTAVGRLKKNSATPDGNFAVSPITVTGQTAATTMSFEFTGANAAGGSTIATNTGTLGTVKLEFGATATLFAPDNISIAMLRCMRFYEKSYAYATAPGSNATVGEFKHVGGVDDAFLWYTTINFRVVKASTAPTITFYTEGGVAGSWNVNALGVGTSIAVSGGDLGDASVTPVITTACPAWSVVQAGGHWTAEVIL